MDDWAVWRAIYSDGSVINQKEMQVSYEDLDREKLREFQMLRDGQVVLVVPLKEGQGGRLIWRRRVQVIPGGGHRFFYLVGKRSAFVSVMFDNGAIVTDDNFSDEHVLYSEIEKVRGEE